MKQLRLVQTVVCRAAPVGFWRSVRGLSRSVADREAVGHCTGGWGRSHTRIRAHQGRAASPSLPGAEFVELGPNGSPPPEISGPYPPGGWRADHAVSLPPPFSVPVSVFGLLVGPGISAGPGRGFSSVRPVCFHYSTKIVLLKMKLLFICYFSSYYLSSNY